MGKTGKKIQRIDFSASDWLGGTIALSLAERGLYITICALIYVAGGPIGKEDLRKATPSGRPETFNRLLLRLVDAGKITLRDGIIGQIRCEREIDRARLRIDKLSPGISTRPTGCQPKRQIGLKAVTNESDSSPHVLNETKPLVDPLRARTLPGETKGKKEELKTSEGSSRRSAPARECAQVPPPTEADKAAVAEMVKRVTETSVGNVAKGIRDPAIYAAAIADRKFGNVLATVNSYASTKLEGNARLEAWEAVAIAQIAGSWAAMPRDAKALLRRLQKLADAAEHSARQVAEAAD